MALHPLAGKPPPPSLWADIPKLVSAYYTEVPDSEDTAQRVKFGTSGHRGSALSGSFNEAHVMAMTEAVVRHRHRAGITGPLFLGRDTHALSTPAERTALEVLAAHKVTVLVAEEGEPTPTPAVSRAILRFNRNRSEGWADGLIITPSHNPPEDGGFKYNPPNGGPADASITQPIEDEANELLGTSSIKRLPYGRALACCQPYPFKANYVEELASVIDMEAIRQAKLHLGVDPLGGSGIYYWEAISEQYGISFEVVNDYLDPTFSFVTVDHDGKIRMDCSSPHAMAGLIALKDRFDLAFGNDADYDRHGIVTRSSGLMNPNHYLSVAIDYLFSHRPSWSPSACIGKTLVSSAMIDRIARATERPLVEVPVGFKWFVEGLSSGKLGFGGEESAGASFLAQDGSVWTTDKDGIILDLLAAEILARTGKDPGEKYQELSERFGTPTYARIDAPASPDQKKALKNLSEDDVRSSELAGFPITAKLTRAPGNKAPIGGLKVTTEMGWFAARPSGTENVYKIYAESFSGEEHLRAIQDDAKAIVGEVLKAV